MDPGCKDERMVVEGERNMGNHVFSHALEMKSKVVKSNGMERKKI